MPKVEGNGASRNSRGAEAQRQSSMQTMNSKQAAPTSSRSSSSRPKPPTKIAGGRFECDKKLGAGCFGEVYRGINTDTKDLVAVKFEALEARTQQLEQEAAIMNLVRQGAKEQPQGFAECFFFGREGKYHCLVMDCLGRSLEDQLQIQGGKFRALDTAMMGEQICRRIEYLHSKGIIHRDIKPENFMWGIKGTLHHVYMIDFGLSKRYFDKAHIPFREKLSLTGTARYASINAHKGFEQSRRDDLEAIGHMLLYFLRGALPWSGLDARTKEEKYRKIRQKKEDTPLNDLCAGFPKEFQTYLQYARQLEFVDRPDYTWLRKLFQDVVKQAGDNKSELDYEWISDSDKGGLRSINPYSTPRQPDDVEPGASNSFRWSWCFGGCGAKGVQRVDSPGR